MAAELPLQVSAAPGGVDARVRAATMLRAGELVALSERLRQVVFVGAVGFVGLSTTAALLALPLRDSAVDGVPPASAVASSVALGVLVGVAMWRIADAYRALLRHPWLQLPLVAIAALLLSVASPLRNELWWPACAILMLLATFVPFSRAMGYCAVALAANLLAHVASGSIDDVATVDILGLWIGLPFWTALAAVVPDRLAYFLLRLNSSRTQVAERPPAHVRARAEDDGGARARSRSEAPESRDLTIATSGHAPAQPAVRQASGDRTARLTRRQLQVVLLLSEGRRYTEIGECLGITAGQVHRHVVNAIVRTEVSTASELAALAVAEGVVPRPS